jgi:HlyD family secretion protein
VLNGVGGVFFNKVYMIRKFILPLIALIGVVFAVYTVRRGEKALPPAAPVAAPPTASFAAQIAGAGLVEAASENLAIGTIVPGIVTDVFVSVGQQVKSGEKLFAVDTRDLDAELVTKEAAVQAATRRLERLKQAPRAEDVPPLEARVVEAQAVLSDRQDEFSRLKRIEMNNEGAVSADEINRAKWAVAGAEAQLTGARANLAVVTAGTWKPDLAVAEAELASAQADVQGLKIQYARRTVYAPIDGQILQVDVRPGEYATAGFLNQPMMTLGQTSSLHVRVDIDENDAWRLQSGAKAVGSLRGNSALKTDLTFVRIEPYVIPKRSLTGESTERVDTRVLQVIYKVQNATFPVYVGQQMDVFIEAQK